MDKLNKFKKTKVYKIIQKKRNYNDYDTFFGALINDIYWKELEGWEREILKKYEK